MVSKYVYVAKQVMFKSYDHIANHCLLVLGPGQIRRVNLAGNPKKAASTGKLISPQTGQLFSTPTRLRKGLRASFCNNGPNVGKNHGNIYSFGFSSFGLSSFGFSCVVLKI